MYACMYVFYIPSMPKSLSRVMLVMTYIGGAISLMRTGTSDVPFSSPINRDSLADGLDAFVCKARHLDVCANFLLAEGPSLRLTYIRYIRHKHMYFVSSSASSPLPRYRHREKWSSPVSASCDLEIKASSSYAC